MAEKRPSPSLEEEDQIAKMSQLSLSPPVEAPKAIIQTGPLFTPGIGEGLIKILSQLDPSSLLKFSRTCKAVHNFCYNTKEIRAPFPCTIQAARQDAIEIELYQSGNMRRFGEQELQKLQKMPFFISVEELILVRADSPVMEAVYQLLRRFPRVVVKSVTPWWTEDWNDLISFLQDYNVDRVCIISRGSVIPVDLLPFFLTNLDYFNYHEHVADDLILSATAKELCLPDARISKYTFMDLLQKYANEDIVHCKIGRERHRDWNESDPFIVACSEVMKVVKLEEIDRKHMEPRVLYNRFSDPEMFYLRKSDGSIEKIQIWGNWITFNYRF